MKVVETLGDLRAVCGQLPRPLGLVPTMGALHEGHLSLVRAAAERCHSVGVSLFVNPAQFAPTEDLAAYPRDLDGDLAKLAAEAVDVVWTPPSDEVYPPGFQTWVEVEHVTRPLEGAQRPEHFRGVTTVVTKLFHAFEPQFAYFGQKDAQQCVVIRRMAADLNFPLEVVVRPTVREPDGLAMSSRNAYLSPAERRAASVLYRALTQAAEAYQDGQRQAQALRQRMVETLAAEPLAETQYVSVANPASLEELDGPVESALLSMAVKVGKTRLIDNWLVGDRPLGG